MKTLAFGAAAFLTGGATGASQIPNVTVDLTAVAIALISLVGALVSAGYILSRLQKNRLRADIRLADADADLSSSKAGLTHAQYEGFIAEAAERLSHISDAAIARLEADLARSGQRIAELETELERVKRERDRALADRLIRERELTEEIKALREKVIDLERRLTSAGRRRTDTSPED